MSDQSDILRSREATLSPIGLMSDAKTIISAARCNAYRAVNLVLVQRNWLLGKRIAEEELQGKERAEYGAQLITDLSQALTQEFGNGFAASNLYSFAQFYKAFPDLFYIKNAPASILPDNDIQVAEVLHSSTPKISPQILQTPSVKCSQTDNQSITYKSNILDIFVPRAPILLSLSHYRILLQESNPEARAWYAHEAEDQTWSVRTLQRNISTQYYYRMLQSQNKELVEKEMLTNTAHLQDRLVAIKNPVIAEFMGFQPNYTFSESELEQNIISNLQQFMMELGKGFAFVARQQHIHTEKDDYYIDLVFYNYVLKCFVLIDLKTSKITHQDVGQMDMYIRMYDELKRDASDNPTLGIVLCADTDEDIARYSILKGNEQLFATKYKTYLPTEEELRAEIETQKQLFYLQQAEARKAKDAGC